MEYCNNKIRKQKLFKMALKVSSLTALASFLTLFVGAVNSNKVVTVVDADGKSNNFVLTSDYKKNLEILKKDKNLNLGENDIISVAQTKDGDPVYSIDRMAKFYLDVDGKRLEVCAKASSTVEQAVKEALKEAGAGFELGKFDELSISKLSKVKDIDPNSAVKLDRVFFEETQEEVDIPYKTIYKNDKNLFKGEEKVDVKGKTGKELHKKRYKYINGKKVSSEELGKITLEEKVDEVIKKGTKDRRELEAAFSNKQKRARGKLEENAAKKSGALVGWATHYNKGRGTASGRPLIKGVTVAVNPKQIPYGAILTITDAKTGKVLVKNGVAADRCQSAVDGKVLVDIYGMYIGKKLVKVEWKI